MNAKTRKCDCEIGEGGYICEKHDKPQHTPTPWHQVDNTGALVIDLNGNVMAHCAVQDELPMTERQANAAFIVRAVNSHEELIEALKEVTEWLAASCTTSDGAQTEAIKQANSAIARAEGKNE